VAPSPAMSSRRACWTHILGTQAALCSAEHNGMTMLSSATELAVPSQGHLVQQPCSRRALADRAAAPVGSCSQQLFAVQVDILDLKPRKNPSTGRAYGSNGASSWGWQYK